MIVGIQAFFKRFEHITESILGIVVGLAMVLGATGVVSTAKSNIVGASAMGFAPLPPSDTIDLASGILLYYGPVLMGTWQLARRSLAHGG